MIRLTLEEVLINQDILIMLALTFEVFLEQLEGVFQGLVMANLRLQPQKSIFRYNEVKHLGHIVSNDRVATDHKTI